MGQYFIERRYVVFMADGMAVESVNPADVLDHPQHERTRVFLGRVL